MKSALDLRATLPPLVDLSEGKETWWVRVAEDLETVVGVKNSTQATAVSL